MPLEYGTTPGGTMFGTTPGGTRIVYERAFLLQMRQSPLARTPPANLPVIPGVTAPREDNKRNHSKSNGVHNNENHEKRVQDSPPKAKVPGALLRSDKGLSITLDLVYLTHFLSFSSLDQRRGRRAIFHGHVNDSICQSSTSSQCTYSKPHEYASTIV